MTDSMEKKPIYCLSSDDDDEGEDALLNGSYLHRRRPEQKKPSASPKTAKSKEEGPPAEVTETSNDGSNSSDESNDKKTDSLKSTILQDDDDGDEYADDEEENSLLQKVLRASEETYVVEQEHRRQSLQAESSPAAVLNKENNDPYLSSDDDDDESSLEVLPCRKTARQHAKQGIPSGPRLSFSGQEASDPVNLMDLPQSPIRQSSPIASVKQEKQHDSTRVASPPIWTPLPEPRHFRDNYQPKSPPNHPPPSDHINSNNSSPLDTKPAAVKKRSQLHDEEDDASLGSSASSSDDSFAAQCKAFQASRQANKRRRKSPEAKASNTSASTAAAAVTKSNAKSTTAKMSPRENQARKEQKALDKQAAKEKRKRDRQAAKQQKEHEKQAAKDQRERDKLAKQAAKQAAKKQRQETRERSYQVRGRYANQEVAVLAEPNVLDTNSNQWKIVETLAASGFEHVKAFPSGLSCHALQFIRQEYLHGGAKRAVEDLLQNGPPSQSEASKATYEHISLLAVVMEAHQLIDLIQQDDDDHDNSSIDDDDYPKLEQWLFGLVAAWRAAWRQTPASRPRIILLLHKVPATLDRFWVQYNRSGRRGPCPPNSEQLHDAILWMLIQFQIESVHCPTDDDVGHEIFKLTRLLAETPYVRQATDLQTMAKLPAHVSEMAPTADRARDTWVRQLQQIPRLSGDMAQSVAQHYPTAMSLWKAYQDEGRSLGEKQALLANLFGTRSSRMKLSSHVHRALTSDNPHEILS